MRKQIVNKTNFKCLTPSLTPAKIRNLQEILVQNKKLEEAKNMAELLSGEARLRILYLLASQGSLSVGDIADILKSKPSGVSHQLAVLREAKLVKNRKKEKVVFYTLNENLPPIVRYALGL